MEKLTDVEFLAALHDYLSQDDEDFWKTTLHHFLENALEERGAVYDSEESEWMLGGKPILG